MLEAVHSDRLAANQRPNRLRLTACCTPFVVIAPTSVSMFCAHKKCPNSRGERTCRCLGCPKQIRPGAGILCSGSAKFPLEGNRGSLRAKL